MSFRLLFFRNGKLKSVYSCKTLVSLFIFDISNCIKDHVVLVKCQNCGNYFVPVGRSDTKYCHYPLNDRSQRTCHDVGAQNARSHKEKTDALTRAYRNAYMNLKMAARRHPEDPFYEDISFRVTIFEIIIMLRDVSNR